MPDVIVVGAGVMGASAAFHLAETGADVLIVDKEGPSAGSTARSAALIRAHYPTALEADLAWESLTEYFERWGERVGGGCGFTRTGFVFLAGREDAEKVASNVSMMRRSVGVETDLLGPEELASIAPALSADGVAVAAHEPRGGYADPAATALSLLEAARRLGARFERRRVTKLTERAGGSIGIETEDGPLEAGKVVLCCGAWSVELAAGVGLDLPVKSARIQVALFGRPHSLPTHPAFIDAVNEISGRPTADRSTLVGMRLSELEWIEDPDRLCTEVDHGFAQRAARRLGSRIPALEDAPFRSGWAGVVDMTPDGRPVLGPEGPEGLFLSVGWSGTGFKKAPAVGAELARWVDEGAPKRPGLLTYRLGRFDDGKLVRGAHEYAAKTPH